MGEICLYQLNSFNLYPLISYKQTKMISVLFIDNDDLLAQAFLIRQKVFVEEQNVDYDIEYDEFEDDSRHFLAVYNFVPAGAARWRHTDKGIKLERFAVLKEYRNAGIGESLLNAVLEDVGNPDNTLIYLHAQNQVIPFYEKYGFGVVGDEFEEAGILHHEMIYKPGL
jgi:predicted GNAT family N-acyltransferase